MKGGGIIGSGGATLSWRFWVIGVLFILLLGLDAARPAAEPKLSDTLVFVFELLLGGGILSYLFGVYLMRVDTLEDDPYVKTLLFGQLMICCAAGVFFGILLSLILSVI